MFVVTILKDLCVLVCVGDVCVLLLMLINVPLQNHYKPLQNHYKTITKPLQAQISGVITEISRMDQAVNYKKSITKPLQARSV